MRRGAMVLQQELYCRKTVRKIEEAKCSRRRRRRRKIRRRGKSIRIIRCPISMKWVSKDSRRVESGFGENGTETERISIRSRVK